MRILITGGGTAGHVLPALEVIKVLRTKDQSIEFLWIGSSEGMEKDLVADQGIAFESVPVGKFRRYFSFKNITDILKIPAGILAARKVIRRFKPQVVFSKGGYVSMPTVIAAWMLNVPIVIHESDIVAGLANQKLSWFVTRIALSFPDRGKNFPEEKTQFTGMPVRPEITNGSKETAMQTFGLTGDKPVLFVSGGSQGARVINNTLFEIIPLLLEKFQIIHVSGKKNFEDMKNKTSEYENQGYHLYPYLSDEMAHAYAAADVIISRGGATSIFEIAAIGKRNLLIPLTESANNHQKENAEYFHSVGISELLTEENMTPHVLYERILGIYFDEDEAKVRESAKKMVSPNAAEDLANMVTELIYYGKYKVKRAK